MEIKTVLVAATLLLATALLLATTVYAEDSDRQELIDSNQQELILVNEENIIQANTTQQFNDVLSRVAINEFEYKSSLASKDKQTVIRSNNDTIYSSAVVDASQGVTIISANYDGYQSIYVLDINHSQIALIREGGRVAEISEDMLSDGEHIYIAVRTGINKIDGELDIKSAKKAQRDVIIEAISSNEFIGKNYDLDSLKTMVGKYSRMYQKAPSNFPADKGFGTKGERDEEIAKVVSIIDWGGLPSSEVIDASFSGKGNRKVIVAPKLDLDYDDGGFMSYAAYDEDGWIASDGFSINSNTLEANKDGTYTITFLADGLVPQKTDKNVIVVNKAKPWTGSVRAYRPVDKALTKIEMEKLSKHLTEMLNK